MIDSTLVLSASPSRGVAKLRSAFRRTSALTLAATLASGFVPTRVFAQTPTPEPTASPTTDATTTGSPADGSATESSAAPDPVVQCVESYTEGQRLRNDGHLLEGRAQFWECSKAACPAAIRKDCIAWSEEIRAQIPTVSFRVTLDGKVANEAKVYLDGVLTEKALEGRAVELNPGPHKVRFEYGSHPAQEQEFVAAEGERYRIINAEFHSASPAEPASTGVAGGPLPSSPPTVIERPVPTLTYVFLGLGAVGAVSAAAWGISTSVTVSDLEATCSPQCSQGKIDAVEQRALITDISLGVGAAGFIAAGLTYFLRPEVPASAGSVEFDAQNVGSHGALGLLRVHTN